MKGLGILFVLLVLGLISCSKVGVSPTTSGSAAGTIVTLAGPGHSTSYGGDGGPADNATIGWPTGVAVDADGIVYFTDGAFNVVRKIAVIDGIINKVAGSIYSSTDAVRYSGDGSLAVNARLNVPLSLSIDPSGNVYVADAGNNAVRKIANGSIQSLVGKPSNPSGGYSGDGGPSVEATVFNPYAVAVAPNGDVFIADNENNAIRKIDHTNGFMTTIAGQGPSNPGSTGDGGLATQAKVNSPQGIVADAAGNVYFTDQQVVVRMINPSGIISRFAGNGSSGSSGDGGPATQANLNGPIGLALDDAGSLYIADAGNHAVRKVDATTKVITTIAGTIGIGGYSGDGGPSTMAKLNTPVGVALDKSGNIYIADSQNQRIRIVKPK